MCDENRREMIKTVCPPSCFLLLKCFSSIFGAFCAFNLCGGSEPGPPAARTIASAYGALNHAHIWLFTGQVDQNTGEVLILLFSAISLRSTFSHDDMSTNPGYVLSPVITQRDGGGDSSSSVKVSIEISESQQPVTFTCDGKHPLCLNGMSVQAFIGNKIGVRILHPMRGDTVGSV